MVRAVRITFVGRGNAFVAETWADILLEKLRFVTVVGRL